MIPAGLKRRLYQGGRPGWIARLLNRGWAYLHAWGIAPNWMITLEVVGRKSGRVISFPLVLAVVDGERYLVSMLGESAWVQNVRAAGGKAVMKHGRTEGVRLEEVDVAQRPAIIKAYLKRAPGARPHIPVDQNAPVEDFVPIAAQIPVFRVIADQ